jgi:hypothetical protein
MELKHRAYNEIQENLVQFLDQKSFYSVESILHAKISVKFFCFPPQSRFTGNPDYSSPQMVKVTEGLLYKEK